MVNRIKIERDWMKYVGNHITLNDRTDHKLKELAIITPWFVMFTLFRSVYSSSDDTTRNATRSGQVL